MNHFNYWSLDNKESLQIRNSITDLQRQLLMFFTDAYTII